MIGMRTKLTNLDNMIGYVDSRIRQMTCQLIPWGHPTKCQLIRPILELTAEKSSYN